MLRLPIRSHDFLKAASSMLLAAAVLIGGLASYAQQPQSPGPPPEQALPPAAQPAATPPPQQPAQLPVPAPQQPAQQVPPQPQAPLALPPAQTQAMPRTGAPPPGAVASPGTQFPPGAAMPPVPSLQPPSPVPIPAQATPESAEAQAVEAFWTQHCSSCHGLKGAGDGAWHTLFMPEPANLTLVQDSYAMMFSIVLNGVPGTMMPSFPTLDQETFNNILSFLQTQPRDLTNQWDYAWSLPEGPMGREVDPQVGLTQFTSFCAGCHGHDGSGQSDYGSNALIWPKPANLQARSSDVGRIFCIVTNGRKGTMMPYEKDRLPEMSRWSVSRYVSTLWNGSSQSTIQVPAQPIQTVRNPYYGGDSQVLTVGRNQLNLWCAPCHGADGVGSFIAPRLIDRTWKYGGGTDTGLFVVLLQGIPGRLMPAWNDVDEDLRWKFITYIRSHGGLPDPLSMEMEQRPLQPARHGPGEQ